MKVNYVLMYGTPYLRYKEFETFEDISKFLVHKGYVNYSIFKKLEDKEEVEMIYRDNDIHYLEKENKRLNNIINKAKIFCEDVVEEHKNGEYNVSTTQLAIEEHKKSITYVLRILNGDLENYWRSDKE